MRSFLITVAVAVAVGVLIAVGAAQLFDETTSEPGPPPTAADMAARVDRVTAGLGREPLYPDPESTEQLDAAELTALRARIDGMDVPLYVAVVPLLTEDESAGQADSLLQRLHDKLRDDGVYAVADPQSGRIELADYGSPIHTDYLMQLPEDIAYPDRGDSDDLQLAERLGSLVDYLDDAPAQSGEDYPPGELYPPPDPVAEDELPSLFAADFGPGIGVGAVAALLLFGLVAGGVAVVRRVGAGAAGVPPVVVPGSGSGSGYDAPPDPSAAYLRRTAHDEIDALGREFEAADPDGDVRRRVWDCLDAAHLLIDSEEDGRIDADAEPAALAAAIVLARAGRATLQQDAPGAADRCCELNPLHGPAVDKRRVRYDRHRAARGLPLCAACRSAALLAPRDAHVLRLTLPGTEDGGARLPYDEAPGPLPAVRNGLSQFIRQVQEYAGVH